MKKIVFLDLNQNSFGGVAGVNASLMRGLQQAGYEVTALYLRALDQKGLPKVPGVREIVVRSNRPWELVQGAEIKAALREKMPFRAISLACRRLGDAIRRDHDFSLVQMMLKRLAPDLIVVSHYLLLEAVPEELLQKAVFHAHTSYAASFSVPAEAKILSALRGKIRYLWLSRAICELAKADGFADSFYLYNPVKFTVSKTAPVQSAKKLVAITRLSPEKRLDEMARVVLRAFDRASDKNWRLEIWGTGPEEEKIRAAIGGDARVSLMGRTNEPEKVLLSSSLSLNTSAFEGFSLSVLEAAECGVPTLSFRFGEACDEEIVDGKTGILIAQDDWRAFEDALVLLLSDSERLSALSLGAKEFARGFHLPAVVARFTELFLKEED